MTQILIPSTDLLRTHDARDAFDRLLDALVAAESIPVTGGDILTIAGQRTARYGPLVRIVTDRRFGDPRGASWAAKLVTYVTPDDANRVLVRMIEEGRTFYAIEARRGALGGTATR